MTEVVSLIGLGVVALLVNLLLTRAADRLARRADESDGSTFDVRPLHPRIQAVRTDFAAQSSLKSVNSPYHEELIESARKAISKMAFFQCRSETFASLPVGNDRR